MSDKVSEAALSPEMVVLLAQLSGVTARLEKAVERLEGSLDDDLGADNRGLERT